MVLNSRQFKFLKNYRNLTVKSSAKREYRDENLFLKCDRALSKLITRASGNFECMRVRIRNTWLDHHLCAFFVKLFTSFLSGMGLQPINSIGFLFLLCELDNEVRSIHIDFSSGISVYLILIDRDAKRNASTLLSASLSINMR